MAADVNSSRRRFVSATAAAGMLASLPRKLWAQSAAPVFAVERLSDSLGVVRGAGANVVVRTHSAGVLMVDGGLAEHAPALLKQVSTLPQGEHVSTLFNTHWHPEQTGCNQVLGSRGTTIIAHENTRLWLTTDITRPWESRTYPPLPARAHPTKTFYDNGAIDCDGERVEYGYLRQAHTDGDLFVFFRGQNVLVAGGAVTGEGWPFIDWWTGGWIGGVVDALDTLIGLVDDSTRIVPATGPVLSRADLRAQRQMYGDIYATLLKLLRSGRGPDEAVAAAPTRAFDAVQRGDPEPFVRRAFESLWGHFSPDT